MIDMEATNCIPQAIEEKQSHQQRPSSASWLTVERAAYIALGLLAAVLRLAQLGLRPLTEAEATQALAAFRFTHDAAQAAPAGTIPALFTGNVAAFTLFGAGDAVARWLPALAGLILVLLPYGLRHRLGRGGALAASFLLAISPTAVYCSRALDGAILVAAAGLALVIGLIGHVDTHRPAYLSLAALSLGLGLCSGPGMLTLLAIVGLYALWLLISARRLGHSDGWQALQQAWQAARDEAGLPARLGLTLAAVFGLVATTLVLHPAGIGHAADLLGAWIRSFGPEPGGQPALYLVVLILRYEPLLLLLGLVAAIQWWATRRRRSHTEAGPAFSHVPLLAFWAAAAAVVILASGHRSAGNLLLVLVPLALLAGEGIERTWRSLARRAPWPEAAVVCAIALALIVFFYMQVTRYTLTVDGSTILVLGTSLQVSTGTLLLALVALLLLIGLGVLAWYWRGAAVVTAAAWLTAVALLALFGFSGAWSASLSHAADPREVLNAQPTPPDVRQLVTELEALSQTRTGDTHVLPITVEAAAGPVVAWYLRPFERQTVIESLAGQPVPSETQAAVTLAAKDLPIGQTFRGQSFPLRTYWLPWGLGNRQIIRWLLFAEGYEPVVDREVVLWVSDEGQVVKQHDH